MTKKRMREMNFGADKLRPCSLPSKRKLFDMNDMMLEATRLTRANRLIEATAVIQRMLRGENDCEITGLGDRPPTQHAPPHAPAHPRQICAAGIGRAAQASALGIRPADCDYLQIAFAEWRMAWCRGAVRLGADARAWPRAGLSRGPAGRPKYAPKHKM